MEMTIHSCPVHGQTKFVILTIKEVEELYQQRFGVCIECLIKKLGETVMAQELIIIS